MEQHGALRVMSRAEKVVSLSEATAYAADGSTVAFGGFWYHNQPAAFARELVRRGAQRLAVSGSPVGGYAQDLLLGAGVATRVVTPHISFDDYGLSPNLRYAVEGGYAVVDDCDEAALVGGFRASAQTLAALPVRSLRQTWLAVNSPLVRAGDGRLSEREAVAFAPDLVVLHVACADAYGNGVHLRSPFADRVLAWAGRKVVLTTEKIVSNEEIRSDPRHTTIPSFLVDAVVEAPHGARPGSCHGLYRADDAALSAYVSAADRRRRGDPGPWEEVLASVAAGEEEWR